MTAENQILSADQHKHLSLLDSEFEPSVASLTSCSLIANEIFAAAGSFPLVLMKDQETSNFVLSAIFCLQSDKNNFYRDGQWLAPYTPLNLRRQPFSFLFERGSDSVSPVIDVNSPLLSEEKGTKIFDQTGKPSAPLAQKLAVLEALNAGRARTESLINTLLEFDLVKAIKIKLETSEQTRWVSGLYGIDIEKLNEKDETLFAQLAKMDVLEDALTMKASFSQIGRLVWMENHTSAQPIIKYSLVTD